MTDKLILEIYSKHVSIDDHDEIFEEHICDAFKEYAEAWHSAKMTEVTDEDIEARASDIADPESRLAFERGEWLGFKEGAEAMRNGEIKHKEG